MHCKTGIKFNPVRHCNDRLLWGLPVCVHALQCLWTCKPSIFSCLIFAPSKHTCWWQFHPRSLWPYLHGLMDKQHLWMADGHRHFINIFKDWNDHYLEWVSYRFYITYVIQRQCCISAQNSNTAILVKHPPSDSTIYISMHLILYISWAF